MKKRLLIFLCVCTFGVIKAQAPVPYTAKILSSTGPFSSTSTRICPASAGSATIQATAGWPFGAGYNAVKNLYIASGHTITIPCGAVADYNTIQIDSGGVLKIDTGASWTYIGCKGAFILNGSIVGRDGRSGKHVAYEPASDGNLTGDSIPWTTVQGNGGKGGNSGTAHAQSSYGTVFPGGNQFNGNAGGGAAGMGLYRWSSCGCWTIDNNQGGAGGDATELMSGYGSSNLNSAGGSVFPQTPAVSIYSQDGNSSARYTNNSISVDATAGGSGGTRGKHGCLIYIQAMQGISGTGTIDVRGYAGGNGGNSGDCAQGPDGISLEYSSSGGGGGGGAGGSGGYVYINYVGSTLPTNQVLVAGGAGGTGGTAGINDFGPPNSSGQGQNGFPGDNGAVGVYTSNLISNYSYQWYKNTFTQIPGATLETYTATSAGYYDCNIIDIKGGSHWTSGAYPARPDKDTVLSDGTPVAMIVQAPSSICAGDTATLVAAYYAGQTYQWYLNGSPIGSATADTTLLTTSGGTYLVAALNTCNNVVGVPSNTVSLTAHPTPPTPTVTPGGSTTVCEGTNVVLSSSYANQNSWSTGATTNIISVTQAGTNTISVTYTDPSTNCSATSAIDTVIIKPAHVNAGPDSSLVCGYNLVLNAITNPTTTTSVNWSPTTFLSNASVLNPVCTPTTAVSYTVSVNFTNGCSASDVINISSNPGTVPQICMVTADTVVAGDTTLYNIILWNKMTYVNADSFIIYREVSTNLYKRIGAVSINALSQFNDTAQSIGPANGDPNITSYKYKLQIRDTCGNYSAMGPYHNSLHFTDNGSGNFNWNIYDVEGQQTPVQNFFLMRDNFNTGVWVQVGSCAGSQTNGISDPFYSTYQATANWRIDADGFNCTPTMRYGNNSSQTTVVKSKSNISNNRTVAINQLSTNARVKIFPNPTTGPVTIEMTNLSPQAIIEVYDFLGKRIFTETLLNKNSSIRIDDLNSGIYQLRISCQGQPVYQNKIVKE